MSNTVILTLKDGNFEISKNEARQSLLFSDMIVENEDDIHEIPVDAEYELMKKVIEFLKYHANNPMKIIEKPISINDMEELVGKWDSDFINFKTDKYNLISIISIANFLNIPTLLDLGLSKMALLIKNKSPDELLKYFDIDATEEDFDFDEIRKNNQWLFEM